MKLHFKQQQYQIEATEALIRVFDGQNKESGKQVLGRELYNKGQLDQQWVDEYMFANRRLDLDYSKLLSNLQKIQKEQGLPVSQKLEGGYNFTVEMETGTGKTYVYTKSMFELNRAYGWNKFIIMVPSIAIREGVLKSLQITSDHFQELYGKKLRYFAYDTKNSSNLVNIKKFVQSSEIEVIVMNYQAFGSRGKDNRKIFQEIDALNSEKPIDLIRKTNPILIIDEPQRFGKTAESMLQEFSPLFIVRYSATHKEEFNKIYRLDAIDAYNKKLVKKIRVKGIEAKGSTGTNSYLFLDRINISTREYPNASIQMEIETKQGNGIKKVLKKIREGDNLYDISGELAQYQGFVVKEINALTNTVSFTNGVSLEVGQVMGNIDEKHIRTIQIREAIASHLEKEQELYALGIKVLTLFFIDEVSKYRAYDEAGNIIRSEYEEIFEREYTRAVSQQNLLAPEYEQYLNQWEVSKIHNGYFSIDKKGRAIDSKDKQSEGGSDDIDAYNLIMKEKERLLSLSEPTRFIFSHSALREGWDNPNIFQICTLRHSSSSISKRQEIGRGLRIAVNQYGERMDFSALDDRFFDVNTVTIIANESYDTFANELQREIFDSLSHRPIIVEVPLFEGKLLKSKDGEDSMTMTSKDAMDLIMKLNKENYIDENYHITDTLVQGISTGDWSVPESLEPYKEHLAEILMSVYNTSVYKATENDRKQNIKEENIKPNDNFYKQEFQNLWSKLKVKTSYTVSFDTEELVDVSIKAIDRELNVQRVMIQVTKGEQVNEIRTEYVKTKTTMTKLSSQMHKAENVLGDLKYDLIAEIAKEANITRKTVAKILSRISPHKFMLFQENPEHFIKEVSRIIQEQKATTLINHITYNQTGQIYEDDVFTINNLRGELGKNIQEVKRHIYSYVKTDSEIEYRFADDLEKNNENVLVYAKLPRGFFIPTPVGNYNPDWAIVFYERNIKHIYFIAETKGSLSSMQLKTVEKLKIDYAKKHFEALGHDSVIYDVVDTYQHLMDKVMR
jgi:type III restriction enzyme